MLLGILTYVPTVYDDPRLWLPVHPHRTQPTRHARRRPDRLAQAWAVLRPQARRTGRHRDGQAR